MKYSKEWIEKKLNRLNKIDYHARDIILRVENQKYIGGLVSFINLDLERLEELIKNKFVKLDSRQNNSPTVQEFYEFMKKYPHTKAHGYAKSDEDGRVAIEGLHYTSPRISKDLQLDFMKLCRSADSLTCTDKKLYSWWD